MSRSAFGRVPVDPADAREVVFEEPLGHLVVSDAKVEHVRRTLFGASETDWIAFKVAHNVARPGSAQAPLCFIMYPRAETA